MNMSSLTIIFAPFAMCACSVTQPVAVIGSKGQILRGTATASLSGGTFQASDGKLTCTGNYDALTESRATQAVVVCNDGRKGFASIQRDATGQSGTGRVRLDDGSEADFIFGPAANAI